MLLCVNNDQCVEIVKDLRFPRKVFLEVSLDLSIALVYMNGVTAAQTDRVGVHHKSGEAESV